MTDPITPPPSRLWSSPRIVFAILGVIVLNVAIVGFKLSFPSSFGRDDYLIDFHAFYITSKLALQGHFNSAYTPEILQANGAGSEDAFLLWSYPPPFGLVVSPLALLPIGLAYMAFTLATMALYLTILKRLCGGYLAATLLCLFPAMVTSAVIGQNGFLTGAIIGSCLLLLQNDKVRAGIPLGLMVIKPHLGVAIGILTLGKGRWRTLGLGFAVVAALCALATLTFGLGVWPAFIEGLNAANASLTQGGLRLARFISLYATLKSFGFNNMIAMSGQVLSAIGAIVCLSYLIYKRVSFVLQASMTALASVLVSPYLYDYDLLIAGLAVAIVMPLVIEKGTNIEKTIFIGSCLITTSWGNIISILGELISSLLKVDSASDAALTDYSIGFVTMMCAAAVVLKIARRQTAS